MYETPGLQTLTQEFSFPDSNVNDLANVLTNAPLVGDGSIFGNRVAESTTSDGDVRRLHGFEPVSVPLLRFDVETRQHKTGTGVEIILEFSQPSRRRPYLAGQFVWLLTDSDDGTTAVLREEINTSIALSIVDRPLHGRRFSLRRYLFFAGGHQRLMKDVAANIRTLLA